MAYIRAKKSKRNKRINSTKTASKAKKRRRVNLTGFAKPILEKTWDKKRTVRENFKSLGLVVNANQAVPIPISRKPKPLWKRELAGEELEEEVAFMVEADKAAPVAEEPMPSLPTDAVRALERLAGTGTKLERHVAPGEADFIVTMMKAHGSDYKAMGRDKRNYYQHTPKQIKRKVEAFLRSKQCQQAMELCRESRAGVSMET